MNIIDAVLSLNPKAELTVEEEDYSKITWRNGTIPIPQADIKTELTKLTAEYDANQYQRDRQYPQLGEQLDMLFHDMTAGKGTKDGEWYKAIAEVKADNPKG